MSETPYQPEYPNVEGEKGYGFNIQEILKRPENNFHFVSASGRKINVLKHEAHIEFQDDRSPDKFHLKAYVKDGIASFDVSTDIQSKIKLLNIKKHNRHPDFFAVKFVNCALEYFKQNNQDIQAIQGSWLGGSVNSEEFFDNLENKKMSPAEAAKNTWSGRVFISHGFSQVTDQDVILSDFGGKKPLVNAFFRKPQ